MPLSRWPIAAMMLFTLLALTGCKGEVPQANVGDDQLNEGPGTPNAKPPSEEGFVKLAFPNF